MLTAYRVADPPPKIVTPLMPNFALIVAFAQRYDKGAGGGTIVVDKSARPSVQKSEQTGTRFRSKAAGDFGGKRQVISLQSGT